jgi:hypothetical protein
MARTGRPKAVLELTAEEREQLQRWARRATSADAEDILERLGRLLHRINGAGH